MLTEEVLVVCDKLSSIEVQDPVAPPTGEISSSPSSELTLAKDIVEVDNNIKASDGIILATERVPHSNSAGEETGKPDEFYLTSPSEFNENNWSIDAKDLGRIHWSAYTNLAFTSTSSIEKFLRKVPASELSGLEALTLELWKTKDKESNRSIRIALLNVLEEVENMVRIKITCVNFQQLLNFDMVAVLGTSLRDLQMIDNYPRGSDPTSIHDLEMIKKHCPNIMMLELNLPMFPYSNIGGYKNRIHFQVQEFLALLSQFENLEGLRLTAEHSLGTANPRESSSTDPDYDDAESIVKKLRAAKVGIPFQYIFITLEGAFRPRNWRPAKRPEADGHPDPSKYWCPRRVFRSSTGNYGSVKCGVLEGRERVGEIEETEEEQVKARMEYEKYLEYHGDGKKRHFRPRFSPGMKAMMWKVEKQHAEV